MVITNIEMTTQYTRQDFTHTHTHVLNDKHLKRKII